MTLDEQLHARALELGAQNPGVPVALFEAALREGANAVLDRGIPMVREQREQLERQRAKANAPQ